MLLAAIVSLAVAGDAASIYRETITKLPDHDEAVAVALLHLRHGLPPGPLIKDLLQKTAAEMAALERASREEEIDWGLDYSKGFELLLPELFPMQTGARLLDARLLIETAAGNRAGAAAAFSTITRMGAHLGKQKVLISSLVALSWARMADESVGRLIDMGAIDQDMAGTLALAYAGFEVEDAFDLEAALSNEKNMMLSSIDATLQQPDIEKQEQLAKSLGFSGNGFGRAMLKANLGQAGEAYDAVIAASRLQDDAKALAAMAAVQAKAAAGDYGPLAEALLPACSNCFKVRVDELKTFKARRDVLERIASGELQPWARSTRPWGWILAARLAQEADGDWWTNEKLADAVDLKVLQAMGATDGVWPEPWDELDAPVPWWLPGQWTLLQGLMARAVAHLDEGRGAVAAIETGIALDIAASLAHDGRCAPSLVAAEVLPTLADLVDRLVIAGQDVSQFASTVKRLPPPRDAAGLQRNARQQSARLIAWRDARKDAYEALKKVRELYGGKMTKAELESMRRPAMVSVHASTGVVAQLAALRAVLPPEMLTSLEPSGEFAATAPPGLEPAALQAAVEAALAAPAPLEVFTIPFVPIDPTQAADATMRLRHAVLN
jgi:hypothetical protein